MPDPLKKSRFGVPDNIQPKGQRFGIPDNVTPTTYARSSKGLLGVGGTGARTSVNPNLSASERVLGGLARGVKRDPILGTLYDQLIQNFPEAAEDQINDLIHRTSGSKLADTFALIGEFGPNLIGSVGAFNIGRTLAVKGVAKIGLKSVNKKVASGVSRRALGQVERTGVRQVASKPGREALVGARNLGQLEAMPVIERAAMAAGGAVGFGAFEGAEELADGAPVGDAAKAALPTGALTLGLEGAIFGLTKIPVIGLKGIHNPKTHDKRFAGTAAEELNEQLSLLYKRKDKETATINYILGIGSQEKHILKGQAYQSQLPMKIQKNLTAEAKEELAKHQQLLNISKTEIKATKLMLEKPIQGYLNGAPYNPEGLALVLAKARLATIQTPESFKGQLGRTMNKFLEEVGKAEAETTLGIDISKAAIKTMQAEMGRALGYSKKTAKDGRNFLRVFNAWEKYGEKGIDQFMKNEGRSVAQTETVQGIFKEYDRAMGKYFDVLVKLGAERKLGPKELAKLGVAKYIPHVFADIPESSIIARLEKVMGRKRAQEMFNETMRPGLGKFSSIDWQRKFGGTLAEKVLPLRPGEAWSGKYAREGAEAGLPFNVNPWDATFQYMTATHRRTAYGQRFGLSGQLAPSIMEAAVKEGASAPLVESLLNMALGHNFHDAALQQFSRAVTGLETGSKLGLAVIPNFSQSVNTILFGGFKNFTKGLMKATDKEGRVQVIQSVALAESIVEGLGRTFGPSFLQGTRDKGTFATSSRLLDGFAHGTLKWTGFTKVEGWNRVMAGATGHAMMQDILSKSVAGKLKGGTLDRARRQMQSLGLDLDKLTQLARTHGDDFMTSEPFKEVVKLGMYNASVTTQFNPNILRKPLLWTHPLGRVMSQFKTFALGQGRFIRDQVLLEAREGNLKPLAYFMSIYPMAGEVISEAKAFAKMQDRKSFSLTGEDDLDRVIQDFTMVGGLGILSDLYTSARFGESLNAFVGPGIGDFADISAQLAQGKPENTLKKVLNTPTAHAIRGVGTLGLGVAGFTMKEMSDYLEAIEEDEPTKSRNGQSIIDLGVLNTRRR
jgi:hypothetical protein